jgi:hypothetical protein
MGACGQQQNHGCFGGGVVVREWGGSVVREVESHGESVLHRALDCESKSRKSVFAIGRTVIGGGQRQ